MMSDRWDPKLAARRLLANPGLLACDALLDQRRPWLSHTHRRGQRMSRSAPESKLGHAVLPRRWLLLPAMTTVLAEDPPLTATELAPSLRALHEDGITARKGALSREWVEELREDMMTAFWEAIQRPGGAVGRGPRRWYVEAHPQAFRGFIDLVTNPWIAGMCEQVLGPDYEIVEIGLDVPFQGAKYQPWHRDFPSPTETYQGRRITSLAFNITGVDVTPDMGPLEVAHGTQWEDGREWRNGMFPARELWGRYNDLAVRKFPQAGDVSCRSALTMHRGTEHRSPISRPVLVIGVDAPGAGHAALHDLMVTQEYFDAMPPLARDHLVCRVVDQLVPITQKHQIEGLVMGAEA
ncbi:MAG: phytanoyl-CoA dioxygenase family protein [Ramlibacter sp.]